MIRRDTRIESVSCSGIHSMTCFSGNSASTRPHFHERNDSRGCSKLIYMQQYTAKTQNLTKYACLNYNWISIYIWYKTQSRRKIAFQWQFFNFFVLNTSFSSFLKLDFEVAFFFPVHRTFSAAVFLWSLGEGDKEARGRGRERAREWWEGSSSERRGASCLNKQWPLQSFLHLTNEPCLSAVIAAGQTPGQPDCYCSKWVCWSLLVHIIKGKETTLRHSVCVCVCVWIYTFSRLPLIASWFSALSGLQLLEQHLNVITQKQNRCVGPSWTFNIRCLEITVSPCTDQVLL